MYPIFYFTTCFAAQEKSGVRARNSAKCLACIRTRGIFESLALASLSLPAALHGTYEVSTVSADFIDERFPPLCAGNNLEHPPWLALSDAVAVGSAAYDLDDTMREARHATAAVPSCARPRAHSARKKRPARRPGSIRCAAGRPMSSRDALIADEPTPAVKRHWSALLASHWSLWRL